MRLKLKSRRIRPIEELRAMEEKFPVCGPSPPAYAPATVETFQVLRGISRRQRANGNARSKSFSTAASFAAA